MYSNSSSFLGGGNSARPGQQPPYGQQSSFLNPNQPTGFGAPQPLQNQYTGFPGQPQQYGQQTGQPQQFGQQSQFGQQPIQQQFTGYPGQQQPMPTGFGQQPQSQPQIPQQQPMPTGFGQQPQSQPQIPQQSFQAPQPTGAPAVQPQRPQPTGMTSSQMADSFRSTSSQPAPPPKSAPLGSKIPNIRLSFITAQDQAKFEQLFKSAVGNGGALSGDQARDILMRSKLGGNDLSNIWLVINWRTFTLC